MRDHKRVLFVLPQMKQGGAERVVFNIIKGLDRSRFMPCIAWFHGERVYPFSELKYVPMFFLNKQTGFDLNAIISLRKIIRREGIAIVNPHHFMPLFYAFPACKMGKCKLVYTEHSVWEAKQSSGMWKIITQFLLRRTNAIVGVSPEITAFLKQRYGLSNARVRTILNGIDTQQFEPIQIDNSFRNTLGLDKSHIAIGMTGNFRKVKNHSLLIRAFADVSSRCPNARLVLIGQGFPGDSENSENEVRRLVREYQIENEVIFLGYRDDVHKALQCIDIFCLTSLREGLPLSVIEAMACALPIVGTDVDGIRVVVDSGRNGILVESGNYSDLAHALALLIDDASLRQRMGNEARRDAETFYSLGQFSKEYNQLFASLT